MRTQSIRRFAARHGQRGFGMVEVSVVLVLVAIVLGVVFNAYTNNVRRTQIQSNVSEITETAAEMQKKFGVTNTYGAVTTALAVQSRAIPDSLRIPGTNTAQNSYGGQITTAPATLTQANDAVDLTWASVPQNQCMDVVVGTQQVSRRVTVAGVVVKPIDGQLNLGTLATQCESAGNVDVILSVGRG